MANLIDKSTDLRVWGYWRTINLIGNFDANPDPIVRDNIMLSAYLAEQINAYEAATGSTRFDEPGSLTFVWKDGRTFAYDHHRIVEAVARNFAANELGFFPCEPGWVFTACNTQGAQALKGHDTLHGTDFWARTEAQLAPRRRWRDAHTRRQPAPHQVEDHRPVLRHRRGAGWRVLPHRHERLRRRGARPRRAGHAPVAARGRPQDGGPARVDPRRRARPRTDPEAGAQHAHRHRRARVDAPHGRRPHDRRRGAGPGRPAGHGPLAAPRGSAGRNARCTPASRPSASTSCSAGRRR